MKPSFHGKFRLDGNGFAMCEFRFFYPSTMTPEIADEIVKRLWAEMQEDLTKKFISLGFTLNEST